MSSLYAYIYDMESLGGYYLHKKAVHYKLPMPRIQILDRFYCGLGEAIEVIFRIMAIDA